MEEARRKCSRQPRRQAKAESEPEPVRETRPRADHLLTRSKRQLAADIYAAHAACNEARGALDAIQSTWQARYADVEERYLNLIQDHMGCCQTIMALRAELAEQQDFLDRFRDTAQRRPWYNQDKPATGYRGGDNGDKVDDTWP